MADQSQAGGQIDDVELILRMMDGDEKALSCVIRHYGPKVMRALRGKYGSLVSKDVLEDAIHRAAYSVWRNAGKFDDSKGSLGGLYYKCACHEVVNILRHGDKVQPISIDALDIDMSATQVGPPGSEDEQLTPEKQRLYQDLHDVIGRLPNAQRAIVEADLAAGCNADNDYLAQALGTSKNSIYVSRNKAREKIKQEMRRRGYFE